MSRTEWSIQDAKNRFSAVVDAAIKGAPQRVTRRGKATVMVISVEEYERLRQLERAATPTFTDLLIAATALEHGLTVVIRNERHFQATGVPVFNPFL